MGNHFGLIQGHLDFNLSDEGRRQAIRTSGEIKKIIGKERPLIFSSDLSRAWETAVIISEQLGVDLPIPDRRLRERNMGILQNTHWTTVNWEKVNKSEQKIINLETRERLLERIADFLNFIMANKPVIGEAVIAVTHGGTMTHIYHLLLEVDIDKVPHIGNASANIFTLVEESGKIRGKFEH
jgi:broad specificity phosphatase PhoE